MSQLPWKLDNIAVASEPVGGNKEIPSGEILTVIMDEFEVEHKPSGAVMANIRYTVTEGEYERFKVWHSMNLVTKAGVVNEITKGQLEWIAQKIGLTEDTAADTNNFLNRPMLIQVDYEEQTKEQKAAGYKPKLIPVKWRSLGQSFDERNVSTAPQPEPTPSPSEPKKPAWHNV